MTKAANERAEDRPIVLTPQQIKELAKLADLLALGSKLCVLVRWGAMAGTGAAAFTYYVLGSWLGWHNMKGN